MRNKTTIFLSHSLKDIDKVRKIRDFFEILNCDALIFYLKCLDDNNPNLEQFIKDEIASRNIFVYCRSKNAEESLWVQKEVEYIKSLDKRLYTLDIEKKISEQLITLLDDIISIVKMTRLCFSYRISDAKTAKTLERYLEQHDYMCLPGSWEICPRVAIHNKMENTIMEASKEGIVVIVLSGDIAPYQGKEIDLALANGAKILILLISEKPCERPDSLVHLPCVEVSSEPTADEMKRVDRALFELSNKK